VGTCPAPWAVIAEETPLSDPVATFGECTDDSFCDSEETPLRDAAKCNGNGALPDVDRRITLDEYIRLRS
jgi:hypothetical protein